MPRAKELAMVRPKVCKALVATFSITLGGSLAVRGLRVAVLRAEVLREAVRGALRRISSCRL